jgi:hypothetical protein
MIEHLQQFDNYILNETNMQNYLKYKIHNDSSQNVKKTKPTHNLSTKPTIFIPKEQDTLFWCYYIIKHGEVQYELLNNRNSLTAKQFKINLVSKIRENKQIIKTYKFDTISNIESNLANDNNISIYTFMTLCAIDNINVIFVNKNTYFEFLINNTDNIYILQEIDRSKLKYNKQYGYEIANSLMLNKIQNTYYKIDNLKKPIKGVSSYKLPELIEIADKLAIQIVNKDTGKNKTKNELYESIIQYF